MGMFSERALVAREMRRAQRNARRGGMIGVSLFGDKRLMRQFDNVGKKGINTALRRAMRSSAKRLHREVLRRVPIDDGEYFEAIEKLKVRSGKRSRKGIRIGVDRSALSEEMAQRSLILEYGTKEREGRGIGPPRPHWRPAVDETRAREVIAIREEFIDGILAITRRTK